MKSRLNSIAGAISDSWQGSSSAAYANVLHDFDIRTSEMMEILEAFKEYIENQQRILKKLTENQPTEYAIHSERKERIYMISIDTDMLRQLAAAAKKQTKR